MKLRTILLALLLMQLFVPAAGAIYIPGQETPDDGLYHIMSGDEAVPAYQGIPGVIALPSLMPFQVPYSINVYPAIAIPQIDENEYINLGDVIGHVITPPIPIFWENIGLGSLNVNMPML